MNNIYRERDQDVVLIQKRIIIIKIIEQRYERYNNKKNHFCSKFNAEFNNKEWMNEWRNPSFLNVSHASHGSKGHTHTHKHTQHEIYFYRLKKTKKIFFPPFEMITILMMIMMIIIRISFIKCIINILSSLLFCRFCVCVCDNKRSNKKKILKWNGTENEKRRKNKKNNECKESSKYVQEENQNERMKETNINKNMNIHFFHQHLFALFK